MLHCHQTIDSSTQQTAVLCTPTEGQSLDSGFKQSRAGLEARHISKAHRVDLSYILEQNQLLTEAVRLRDKQLQHMITALAQHPNHIPSLKQSNIQNGPSIQRNQKKPLQWLTSSLTDQLQSLTLKHNSATSKITELQSKIRQILSKSSLTQAQLHQQIQTLKQDNKYQRDYYERTFDSMKIQFEDKLSTRLLLAEQKGSKEKALLEEEIKNLKRDGHEKMLEIARLTDKLRVIKEIGDNRCKIEENGFKGLKKEFQIMESGLRKQFKEKEEKMNAEFAQDIEHLHSEQRREIQILCQRISSLKTQLAEKDDQVKEEFWKARDYQMGLHYRTQESLKKSLVSCKLKTEGPLPRGPRQPKKSLATEASSSKKDRYSPPFSALKAYMK